MADSGMFRTPPLQGWQRTNIIAAANCLREQIGKTPADQRLRAAYEGLLDLLDPARILARKQREMATAARQAATAIRNERRSRDRRAAERRRLDAGAPPAGERRMRERRSGVERRR